MFMKHYAPNRCEPSIEALIFFLRGGGGGCVGVGLGAEGGQYRCERRNGEVKFLKIKKKKRFSGGGGGGSGRRGGGGGKVWGSG